MALLYAVELIQGYDADGRPLWKMPCPSTFPLLHQTPLYHSHQQYQTIQQVQPVPTQALPTEWDNPNDVAYPTPDGYCVLEPVHWQDVVTLADHCLRGDQYWITYDIANTIATLEDHYGTNLKGLPRETLDPAEETLVEEFLCAVRQFFK